MPCITEIKHGKPSSPPAHRLQGRPQSRPQRTARSPKEDKSIGGVCPRSWTAIWRSWLTLSPPWRMECTNSPPPLSAVQKLIFWEEFYEEESYRMGDAAMHQRRAQDQPQRNPQPPKEDKSVGGVSAKLDYDIEAMTNFVTAMAHVKYEIYSLRICLADIDIFRSISPGKELPPSYRPLHYLSSWLSMLSTGDRPSEVDMYCTVTVALILGSKFLDDNTFINVSGIAVAILNEMETEWLVAIDFKLHRDPRAGVPGMSIGKSTSWFDSIAPTRLFHPYYSAALVGSQPRPGRGQR
ncbi:uncharacterized protein BDZ99DRAFT_521148 [Mytilinidion resinicola]|uniref:Uncharacterized protein n=1 Tax=Mytilinidion resinicola TaxID=574789 RepID=A0A6A6YMP3_9PEZI|nr:uncharacterized protein BDZ99DRAFT_521148 [Mytilinidion resinicola]KAF2809833.1 hypothetical protein BDZ99DRAFT_521148 [Mytilinidion resinicola]